MSQLEVIEVPSEKEAIGTVIWLHGLGASGNDFSPIAPHMQLPDVRFIFPHAPTRPITLNGGWESRAWYDVRTLEITPRRESTAHIIESTELLARLIIQENKRGIPTEQIMICGFSQGGAMALHLGHRYPQKLLGAVVMSGYLVLEDTFALEAAEANEFTPMLFCHGERDLVVSIARGFHAYEKIKTCHANVEWKDYPVGHEVCLEELRHIRLWMHHRFAKLRQQLAENT